MASYAFSNRGAALPYDAPFQTVLKRHIDLPALIATDFGKLALSASPTVPLSSFAGFENADVLEVFEVPLGFVVQNAGVRVSTAEGETADMTLGYVSSTQTILGTGDPNAYLRAADLATATVYCERLVAAGTGNVCFGDIYITAGSIDLTFITAVTYDTAIFDVWVQGFLAY